MGNILSCFDYLVEIVWRNLALGQVSNGRMKLATFDGVVECGVELLRGGFFWHFAVFGLDHLEELHAH